MKPEDRTELEQIALLAAMEEITSGIAHELNQPLSAISLYARGSIRRFESGTSFSQEEFAATLESIAQQAQRAGRIIRQARDRSKLHSIRRDEVTLQELLDPICVEWSQAAERRGIQFRCQVEHGEVQVRVNPVQIRHAVAQVLRNALEAAEETTPTGMTRTVALTTRVVEGCAQVVCSDSGPGAVDDDLESLFQPFTTHKPDHLGLGLGICRAIFRMHGGFANASHCENGTEWIMTLPARSEP